MDELNLKRDLVIGGGAGIVAGLMSLPFVQEFISSVIPLEPAANIIMTAFVAAIAATVVLDASGQFNM